MHRLITGWPMVDHVDHDGLNNQRHNLRPATDETNQHNNRGRLNSSSRYKNAARAYDAAARSEFGEFACLNFPEDPSGSSADDSPAMTPNREGWMPSVKHLQPRCKRCGGPLRIVSKTGICTRNPECAAENKRMHAKAAAA